MTTHRGRPFPPLLLTIAVIAAAPSRPGLQRPTEVPAGCDFASGSSPLVVGQCIMATTSNAGVVGGVSGAFYDNGVLWTVSDAATQSTMVRFPLSLDATPAAALAIGAPQRTVALRRSSRLGGGAIVQAEGLAPSDTDAFWVATEGASPGLFQCDPGSGACTTSVRLPPSFGTMDKKRGIEGLAASPSRKLLAVALEGPRQSAVERRNHWSRLATFETAGTTAGAGREYLYPLDWIAPNGPDEGIGVSDILFVTDRTLLVLERGYFGRCGNTVRLYASSLDDPATAATRSTPAVLKKRFVLDLADHGADLADLQQYGPAWRGKLQRRLENFEALTWGPSLADGSPSLLLVSDDNFKRVGSGNQVTVVVALRWTALWNGGGPIEAGRTPVPRCDHRGAV